MKKHDLDWEDRVTDWPDEDPEVLWFVRIGWNRDHTYLGTVKCSKVTKKQVTVMDCSRTDFRSRFDKERLGHTFFLSEEEARAHLLRQLREKLVDRKKDVADTEADIRLYEGEKR